MTTADFVFQAAEAVSAISLPVGGGLAAYAKWRRNAERDRRQREEAARIASEKAAQNARADEQAMRDKLLAEKDKQIEKLTKENIESRKEIDKLHEHIMTILSNRRTNGQGSSGEGRSGNSQ